MKLLTNMGHNDGHIYMEILFECTSTAFKNSMVGWSVSRRNTAVKFFGLIRRDTNRNNFPMDVL